MVEVFNANPTIFKPVKSDKKHSESLWIDDDEQAQLDIDDNEPEPIDRDEIYGMHPGRADMMPPNFEIELVRTIYDPEHPNTLEELNVVSAPQITITGNRILVEFTPTVPHCGMSTLIGAFPSCGRYFVSSV